MSNERIFVIGSSNVDLIMKMERLPELGETVTNAEFMQTFGGKGANSAVACARAGGNTVFVNAVGEDPYASVLLKNMEEAGINTRFVARESGCVSGHALVMIGQSGHNYLSVAPGANLQVTPAMIDALSEEIASAARILIQNEIPDESNARIQQIAASHGIPVAWNFAPAIPPTPSRFEQLDTLVVNETEAEAIAAASGSATSDPKELLATLCKLGPRVVVITLGGDGLIASDGASTVQLPAFKVDVVDTTGAGDTFCGALAVAMVENQRFEDALRFASAAAAISVTRLGAQPSCPKRDEIERFL